MDVPNTLKDDFLGLLDGTKKWTPKSWIPHPFNGDANPELREQLRTLVEHNIIPYKWQPNHEGLPSPRLGFVVCLVDRDVYLRNLVSNNDKDTSYFVQNVVNPLFREGVTLFMATPLGTNTKKVTAFGKTTSPPPSESEEHQVKNFEEARDAMAQLATSVKRKKKCPHPTQQILGAMIVSATRTAIGNGGFPDAECGRLGEALSNIKTDVPTPEDYWTISDYGWTNYILNYAVMDGNKVQSKPFKYVHGDNDEERKQNLIRDYRHYSDKLLDKISNSAGGYVGDFRLHHTYAFVVVYGEDYNTDTIGIFSRIISGL